MDDIDHTWLLNQSSHIHSSQLTHYRFEAMIDLLENASTRTLVPLDDARILFASSISGTITDQQRQLVYQFWHERRMKQVVCLERRR
jgi:hypothetical protein